MLIELPPDRRAPLRPLFADMPGLHGCLHAALEGTMGRAWTDDAQHPTVARIELEFTFLAGDAASSAAEDLVRSISTFPAYFAVSNDGWPPLLRSVFGERLGEHQRVPFEPGAWDRHRLRGFIDALPPAFVLKRIGLGDAARFTELADSLTYNFRSLEDFIERGVGFGIEHEGRFVSGCSSFAISSHSLEFDIQTHEDVRQRGLASATAAAMILHCIDNDLEPCWDAHNDISAALATKLGFINPKPYTSYELRGPATATG